MGKPGGFGLQLTHGCFDQQYSGAFQVCQNGWTRPPAREGESQTPRQSRTGSSAAGIFWHCQCTPSEPVPHPGSACVSDQRAGLSVSASVPDLNHSVFEPISQPKLVRPASSMNSPVRKVPAFSGRIVGCKTSDSVSRRHGGALPRPTRWHCSPLSSASSVFGGHRGDSPPASATVETSSSGQPRSIATLPARSG